MTMTSTSKTTTTTMLKTMTVLPTLSAKGGSVMSCVGGGSLGGAIPVRAIPIPHTNQLILTGPCIILRAATVAEQVQALKQNRKITAPTAALLSEPAAFATGTTTSTPEPLRCRKRPASSSGGGGGDGGGGEGQKCSPEAEASMTRRNARERKRVKLVNEGFDILRQRVPGGKKNRKMSKVDVLKSAMDYIRLMEQMIKQHDEEVQATSQSHPEHDPGTSAVRLCDEDAGDDLPPSASAAGGGVGGVGGDAEKQTVHGDGITVTDSATVFSDIDVANVSTTKTGPMSVSAAIASIASMNASAVNSNVTIDETANASTLSSVDAANVNAVNASPMTVSAVNFSAKNASTVTVSSLSASAAVNLVNVPVCDKPSPNNNNNNNIFINFNTEKPGGKASETTRDGSVTSGALLHKGPESFGSVPTTSSRLVYCLRAVTSVQSNVPGARPLLPRGGKGVLTATSQGVSPGGITLITLPVQQPRPLPPPHQPNPSVSEGPVVLARCPQTVSRSLLSAKGVGLALSSMTTSVASSSSSSVAGEVSGNSVAGFTGATGSSVTRVTEVTSSNPPGGTFRHTGSMTGVADSSVTGVSSSVNSVSNTAVRGSSSDVSDISAINAMPTDSSNNCQTAGGVRSSLTTLGGVGSLAGQSLSFSLSQPCRRQLSFTQPQPRQKPVQQSSGPQKLLSAQHLHALLRSAQNKQQADHQPPASFSSSWAAASAGLQPNNEEFQEGSSSSSSVFSPVSSEQDDCQQSPGHPVYTTLTSVLLPPEHSGTGASAQAHAWDHAFSSDSLLRLANHPDSDSSLLHRPTVHHLNTDSLLRVADPQEEWFPREEVEGQAGGGGTALVPAPARASLAPCPSLSSTPSHTPESCCYDSTESLGGPLEEELQELSYWITELAKSARDPENLDDMDMDVECTDFMMYNNNVL